MTRGQDQFPSERFSLVPAGLTRVIAINARMVVRQHKTTLPERVAAIQMMAHYLAIHGAEISRVRRFPRDDPSGIVEYTLYARIPDDERAWIRVRNQASRYGLSLTTKHLYILPPEEV